MQERKVIFLAAGGSGGHVFPAVSLAAQLREQGFTVILLTDIRGRKFTKPTQFDSIVELDSATIQFKRPHTWLSSFRALWKGFKSARYHMKLSNPTLVIGFGGYPSLAPLLAAWWKGTSIFIHEQNTVMGRANRLLAKLADRVALAFPISSLKDNPKVTVVGLPIRQEILEILPAPYQAPKVNSRFNLLVFGGSQGASFFSQVLPLSVKLLDKELVKTLHITQQAKDTELAALSRSYTDMRVSHELAVFFDDMASKLKEAHFVIARAGASSAFELFLVGRPSLLVPYPHALDHDQAGNAAAIAKGVGFTVVKQTDLTVECLAEILSNMLANPSAVAEVAEVMQRNQSMLPKYLFRDLIIDYLAHKANL